MHWRWACALPGGVSEQPVVADSAPGSLCRPALGAEVCVQVPEPALQLLTQAGSAGGVALAFPWGRRSCPPGQCLCRCLSGLKKVPSALGL